MRRQGQDEVQRPHAPPPSSPSLAGQSLSAASDALTGEAMAAAATECGALGDGVTFSYSEQPRWLFEALAFVEPTFVYISGLQRWSTDGGEYDLDVGGVEHARKLVAGESTPLHTGLHHHHSSLSR